MKVIEIIAILFAVYAPFVTFFLLLMCMEKGGAE